MKKLLAAVPAALLAVSAQALQPMAHMDAYLWMVDTNTDGFGIKGMVNMQPLFADALIQMGDVAGADFDEIRLGVGLSAIGSAQVTPYAKLELVDIDVELGLDDSGVALQGGLLWTPAPRFNVQAQVGYVDIGNVESSEFLIGAAYEIARPLNALVERRETINGAETRFGVRLSF